MMKDHFSRAYIILRPACGHASGFARMECQRGRGRITVRATQLSGGHQALRALLLSGDAESGSVLDLGLMQPTSRQQGVLRAENVALPGIGTTEGYHTLMLATDWPEARLILYGWLTDPPACTLWQLQEALRHYLAVPAKDSAAPPPSAAETAVPAVPPPETEQHAPVLEHSVCALNTAAARPMRKSVLALTPLAWPEEIAELKVYFDSLTPTAPFEEQGWRYVQVPLEAGSPAPSCAVGIRVQNHCVAEVAYALPGDPGRLPAGGLRGYHWREGRNGQGYWLMTRDLS